MHTCCPVPIKHGLRTTLLLVSLVVLSLTAVALVINEPALLRRVMTEVVFDHQAPVRPIVFDDETTGGVASPTDLQGLYARLRWYKGLSLAALLGFMGLGCLFFARFRTNRNLARAMVELQKTKGQTEVVPRTKTQLLASGSHAIRTPVDSILGMIELLLDTVLTDTQRQFCETMRRSGESLLSIVNGIDDLSKIEAGKLDLEHIDFDLRQIIEEVAESFAEHAHRKGLELACLIPADVPTALRGDPSRLRQILANIVDNAIRFTRQGEVLIAVKTEQARGRQTTARTSDAPFASQPASGETRDSCLLCFEVRDTGIGIPLEAQPQIFDPPSQANGAMPGTGIGLVLAKHLVEVMGGQMGVDSVPGQGSTFWWTVSLQKQSNLPQAPVKPPPNLDRRRVLVADDNTTTRTILHHQVSAWGIQSDSAASGSQALALLRTAAAQGNPYDLAILDMQMPGMAGTELVRAIQADPAIAMVRLIMLTSSQNRNTRSRWQADTAASLSKPVRQAELYDCLVTMLSTIREVIPPQPAVSHSLANAQERHRTRILLAEDNPVNQDVTVGMLEVLGYEADVVANGQEVLQALSCTAYDLILMDCQMPEMDGFEATRGIRSREQCPPAPSAPQDASLQMSSPRPSRVPIIALTASTMEGDREQCLAAGMDDYLCKPFTQEQLRNILARWLPKEPVQRKTALLPVALLRQISSASKDSKEAARAQTPSTTPSPCIDYGVLDNIRALQRRGSPGLLGKVLQRYLDYTPQLMQGLHEAISQNDASTMQKAAHSLKSSSANVGALSLATLCKELEAMGRAQSIDNAPQVFAQVEAEYRAVTEALARELNGNAL